MPPCPPAANVKLMFNCTQCMHALAAINNNIHVGRPHIAIPQKAGLLPTAIPTEVALPMHFPTRFTSPVG